MVTYFLLDLNPLPNLHFHLHVITTYNTGGGRTQLGEADETVEYII